MNDVASELPGPRGTVVDPVSPREINVLGSCFLLVAIVLFYLLITAWPVVNAEGHAFRSINLFGFWCAWAPDRQMMFTVMVAGAIGSLAHTLKSFADYVGNRELSRNWIWFLVLRIPIGVTLAVLFYCIVRGGLLLPTLPTPTLPMPGPHPYDNSLTTLQLNPYGIAGLAALAGMFSKQATDKLAAIFDAVFSVKTPVDRSDALGSRTPIMVAPAVLFQGEPRDLGVTGSGFEDKTVATINGDARTFTYKSATQGTVAVRAEDVKEPRTLELVITNPNKDMFKASINVVARPVISATAVDKAQPQVAVTGEGFKSGCTATVNGSERKVEFTDARTIIVALDPAEVARPGSLKLVITNPDGGAAETAVAVT